MNWSELSMADRAKLIQLGVQNGITDLGTIRDLYSSSVNKFGEGGDTYSDQQENFNRNTKQIKKDLSGLWNMVKAPFTHSLGDYAYAIMANPSYNTTTGGATRSAGDIVSSALNIDKILKSRGSNPRDLASLYIYGNDLGQFRQLDALDLQETIARELRSRGKSDEEIASTPVYEGIFPNDNILPLDITDEQLAEYINSPYNRNYGYMAHDPKFQGQWDDVGEFIQRLSIGRNGHPVVENSDIWDFTPSEYAEKYSTIDGGYDDYLSLYAKAAALDAVGTPFVLKQEADIPRVSDEEFYDNYEDLPTLSREVANHFGYLEPIEIYPPGVENWQTLPITEEPIQRAFGGRLKKK